MHGTIKQVKITTAHSRGDGHSTSISVYGVQRARVGVQLSRRETHTNLHLDQVRVEFYLVYINKKKKSKNLILYNLIYLLNLSNCLNINKNI